MTSLLAAFLLLIVAGAGTIITGVYILAGLGWALIGIGVALLVLALIPRRAMLDE